MDPSALDSGSASHVEATTCGRCLKPCRGLQCARCKTTHYCNGDCQKAHWKEHKKQCVPYQEGGGWPDLPPFAKKGINSLTRADAVAKAKTIDPTDATTVCSKCNRPTVCMSTSEMKLPGGVNSNGCSANAMFMCGEGHTTFVSDARVGSDQNCYCKIQLPPSDISFSDELAARAASFVSSDSRVLVVLGLGGVTAAESCYMQNLKPFFKKQNIAYDVVFADSAKPRQLVERISSGRYRSILLLHVLDSGFENHGYMFTGDSLSHLSAWTKHGGRLLVHGEGDKLSEFMQLFLNKPWHFCGDFYRRCRFGCNLNRFTHFPLRELGADGHSAATTMDSSSIGSDSVSTPENGAGAFVTAVTASAAVGIELPRRINMKAVMLSGVSDTDRLYFPDDGSRAISGVPRFGGHLVPSHRVAVAVSAVDQGMFVFIGDSNAEAKTVALLGSIITMQC
jgi:hypothetical protein